jgi:hypothetical protein
MGDYSRAIDLVTSGRANVTTLVTQRESLDAALEIFRALAQDQPSYVKALLYPNGGRQGQAELSRCARCTSRDSDWLVEHQVGSDHDWIALEEL